MLSAILIRHTRHVGANKFAPTNSCDGKYLHYMNFTFAHSGTTSCTTSLLKQISADMCLQTALGTRALIHGFINGAIIRLCQLIRELPLTTPRRRARSLGSNSIDRFNRLLRRRLRDLLLHQTLRRKCGLNYLCSNIVSVSRTYTSDLYLVYYSG